MWHRGLLSATGVTTKCEKEARIIVNVKDYIVEADCCDFCGGKSEAGYVALRVGREHFAACPMCRERIDTVRVPRRPLTFEIGKK